MREWRREEVISTEYYEFVNFQIGSIKRPPSTIQMNDMKMDENLQLGHIHDAFVRLLCE